MQNINHVFFSIHWPTCFVFHQIKHLHVLVHLFSKYVLNSKHRQLELEELWVCWNNLHILFILTFRTLIVCHKVAENWFQHVKNSKIPKFALLLTTSWCGSLLFHSHVEKGSDIKFLKPQCVTFFLSLKYLSFCR